MHIYSQTTPTKIFKIIKSSDDSTILQEDLTKLEEWSDTWLLRFHPDKCKHMHIGKKNDNSYSLHRKSLEKVIEEKDIGVVIDSDLTFEKHINEKVNKANQMFATLRRTFQFMDKSTFMQLYISLVRTHLDYASSVRAPFKAKHIEQIQGVQRRATKQIPGFRDMTYSERLRDRPFNLHGVVMVFASFRVRIFYLFCRAICFQYLTLGYMTKTLNQIIFFFPPPKSEYLFSNLVNQNILLEENHIPPPWKLNCPFLRALKLPPLSYRRIRGDMIEVYKILNGNTTKTPAQYLSYGKIWHQDLALEETH